jgi:hypothetical protein
VNEDEMRMMAPDPMGLAAVALSEGVSTLTVNDGQAWCRVLRRSGIRPSF